MLSKSIATLVYDQDVHLLLYVKLIEADHLLVPNELTNKFVPAWLSGIVFWDEFNVHRKVFKPLHDMELDPSFDCVLYGNTGIRQGGQLVFRIHPFVTRRDTICIIADKNRVFPDSIDRYTTLIRSGRYRTMRFISMKISTNLSLLLYTVKTTVYFFTDVAII